MTGIQKNTNLSFTVVRTLLELSAVGLGFYLGGLVGIGTILYALGIGLYVFFGLFFVIFGFFWITLDSFQLRVFFFWPVSNYYSGRGNSGSLMLFPKPSCKEKEGFYRIE